MDVQRRLRGIGGVMRVTIESWRYRQWPEIHYGDFTVANDGEYEIPDHLSGSDYSGSLVERSNRDVWSKTFADGYGVWWTEAHGGHGTFAIVVRIADMPDEAREFIDALESYPLADDGHHSNLEMEAQDEAWENWARDEFRSALEKKLDVCSILDTGDQLFELFREACDRSNTYWVNESGDSMYIDVERIVASVTDADLEAFEVESWEDDKPADEPIGPMYLPDRQIFLPFACES